MYSEEFYNAMVDYMEEKGYNRCFTDYKGWSANTGLKFTSQRLSAMYKKGMVERYKDGGCYCYQPIR